MTNRVSPWRIITLLSVALAALALAPGSLALYSFIEHQSNCIPRDSVPGYHIAECADIADVVLITGRLALALLVPFAVLLLIRAVRAFANRKTS